MADGLRVILVHDYLTQFGGAERVLADIQAIFPDAPVFTALYRPDGTWLRFRSSRVTTTYLQRIPGADRHHRLLLPLYPRAMERLVLPECDVVLSSSSAFAKGVRKPPGSVHICYCHNPMRFAWREDDYLERERLPRLMKRALAAYLRRMRAWDLASNEGVDSFLANSENVRGRIAEWYGRDAAVLHPPVALPPFDAGVARTRDGHLLVVSRLVGYKRVDLAVGAANELGTELVVVGEGPDRSRLEALAGPTVRFVGRVEDAQLEGLFARARAVVFPGEEDFGLVPVEAMARGVPVIAFRAGGALETVVEGETGVFFDSPDSGSLASGIRRLDADAWDRATCRRRAEQFSVTAFEAALRIAIAGVVGDRATHTGGGEAA